MDGSGWMDFLVCGVLYVHLCVQVIVSTFEYDKVRVMSGREGKGREGEEFEGKGSGRVKEAES